MAPVTLFCAMITYVKQKEVHKAVRCGSDNDIRRMLPARKKESTETAAVFKNTLQFRMEIRYHVRQSVDG